MVQTHQNSLARELVEGFVVMRLTCLVMDEFFVGQAVYGVVDPIDKVVPSFAVVLSILAIGLGVLLLPFLGIGGGGDVILSFTDTQDLFDALEEHKQCISLI